MQISKAHLAMLIMGSGVILALERLKQEDHKLNVSVGVVTYSMHPPHTTKEWYCLGCTWISFLSLWQTAWHNNFVGGKVFFWLTFLSPQSRQSTMVGVFYLTKLLQLIAAGKKRSTKRQGYWEWRTHSQWSNFLPVAHTSYQLQHLCHRTTCWWSGCYQGILERHSTFKQCWKHSSKLIP